VTVGRMRTAILHVRNVPDELYEELRRRAAAERRSLGGEVVVLLADAIQRPAERYGTLIERIRRDRETLEHEIGRLPSSVDLIREDRER
jgi:plasmid stability protein